MITPRLKNAQETYVIPYLVLAKSNKNINGKYWTKYFSNITRTDFNLVKTKKIINNIEVYYENAF